MRGLGTDNGCWTWSMVGCNSPRNGPKIMREWQLRVQLEWENMALIMCLKMMSKIVGVAVTTHDSLLMDMVGNGCSNQRGVEMCS